MDITKLMAQVNKSLGEDTISFCSAGGPKLNTVSSGSLCLDLALGTGIGTGRILEYYGESMSGKTTMSFLHAAEVQREDKGYVAFVDAEHAMNKELAVEYGVDIDKLIYVNPKTAENAVDTMDALIRSGQVRLIIIDSVKIF